MRPEYGNASKTMKSIKEEIMALIQKVAEGLAILNEVDSPYTRDMKEVFLKTYDIGTAMAERNRLEAAEQKRKEYEAQKKSGTGSQKKGSNPGGGSCRKKNGGEGTGTSAERSD